MPRLVEVPLIVALLLPGSASITLSENNELTADAAVVTGLHPPQYPQMARAARVSGDVKIALLIRQDGSVASADAVGGPPLLKDAALASARNSKFECEAWGDAPRTYSLIYTFGLREDIDCGGKRLRGLRCLYLWKCGRWQDSSPRPTQITEAPGHISIFADAFCIETLTSTSSGNI